jgi:hypothetical protein
MPSSAFNIFQCHGRQAGSRRAARARHDFPSATLRGFMIKLGQHRRPEATSVRKCCRADRYRVITPEGASRLGLGPTAVPPVSDGGLLVALGGQALMRNTCLSEQKRRQSWAELSALSESARLAPWTTNKIRPDSGSRRVHQFLGGAKRDSQALAAPYS